MTLTLELKMSLTATPLAGILPNLTLTKKSIIKTPTILTPVLYQTPV